MIGKLTIDKSNMNFSYFLYSIKLLYENNGRMSRSEFTRKMSSFIGVPASINGKENRTSYNKSKMPRYFGFMDVEKVNKTNDLVITNRGKLCYKYIWDNGSDVEPDERYSIKSEYKNRFRELIIYSIIYDSFGKNNCGAEQSNTDIEPPKVVFKSIIDLEKANAEEICYVLFGLNNAVFSSYDEAIATIKDNRRIGISSYKKFFEDNSLTNIVNDCKVINIFADPNIALLHTFKDDNNITYYDLNSNIASVLRSNLNAMSAIYRPLMLFSKSNINGTQTDNWLQYAILGRLSDTSLLFTHNLNDKNIRATEQNGKYEPSTFENAVLAAFEHEKQNVFLLVKCFSQSDFENKMGDYCYLLSRVDDFTNDEHGWSKNELENTAFYKYLSMHSKNAKKILRLNKIKIPSNLHIVIQIER